MSWFNDEGMQAEGLGWETGQAKACDSNGRRV